MDLIEFSSERKEVKYKMNNRKILYPNTRKITMPVFIALTINTKGVQYFCPNPINMNKYLALLSLILIVAACNEGPKSTETGDPAANAPKQINYSIVATYPHDTNSYTQGLLFYKGDLYEGTGLDAKSKLMKMDLKTGKAIQGIDLPKDVFGEGVTIFNDTVYQLTYQDHKVYMYTLKDFKKIKEFDVPFEGWGLTHDGKNLIVTTGSGDLYFYEPGTFRLLRTQQVTEAGSPTFNLNELEYIDGFVYANQYEYPYIFKINPENGEIVGKIDLSQLWSRIQQMRPQIATGDLVPNGIAWDAATKKLYITGKLWPELYEIQLNQ